MSAYEDDGGAVLFSPGDGGSSVGGWVGSGGICGGGYNKANVEAFCEQTVYRVALSANQLMEQAEAYSDGFDSLAAELHGITQALGGVMDAFSGPSIATRVMRDGGDVGGGQASRRSLRGQRKPGAQLLWPGPEEGGMVQFAGDAGSGTARGFEEEEEEVVEEVAELAGDDLNLHLEGKGPVQGVQDELYGSSILVEMSDQENGNDVAPVVYGGLSKDRKDLDTTASGAASRAVTRPQTTVDDVANREDREGSAEAGQMRHGAPPQDDDDAEPTSADVASPSHHVGAITAKGGGVSEATSTSPTSDAVSESELAEYQAAKEELLSWIRLHGSDSLDEKLIPGVCGLRNQGATCYMNSLLQALFQCPQFRAFVLSWEHDQGRHGPAETSIPAQLQALFLDMGNSQRRSVGTDGLTRSFGWGSAGAFHQHDVSEFLHKLFDALERATDEFDDIRSLFHGHVVNYIGCPEKKIWRFRDEAFLTLQLQVEGLPTLQAAISQYIAPEIMDEDNMWRLDDGSLVPAVKGMWPKRLPGMLVLDLLRFKYDGMSGRVKVNATQSIPQQLKMGCLWRNTGQENEGFENEGFMQHCGGGDEPPGDDVVYDLVAVLLHRGTALGGHYCSCVREWVNEEGGGLGRWLHFDDDRVREIESCDLEVLLSGSDSEAWRGFNAYMLLFRDNRLPSQEQGLLRPNQSLMHRVMADNAHITRLRRIYRIHENVTEIRVSWAVGGKVPVLSVMMPIVATLSQAVAVVRQSVLSGNADPNFAARLSSGYCRLRRYDAYSPSRGETFGGREEKSLEELGLSRVCHLLLEVRQAQDKPFAEHDDWTFEVGKWDREGGKNEPTEWSDVVIRNGVDVTIRLLSAQVLSTLGVIGGGSRVIVVYAGGERGRGCRVMWDSARETSGSAQLLATSGLERGGRIVVEDVLTGVGRGGEEEAKEYQSVALSYYEGRRNSATLTFNHPARPDSYPFSIDADIGWSLRSLKLEIALILSIDASEIHLRRSAKSPQLRDEECTLEALGISHRSTIFVGEGGAREEGHVLLRVCLLGEGRKDSLLHVTASEKDTCFKLKEILHERISNMKPPPPGFAAGSMNAARIRLRDKKGKEIGKILFDQQTLKRALPRLADGKEIAAQFLSSPETVTENDMILLIRFWDVGARSIRPAVEIVLNKRCSPEEMRNIVIKAVPPLPVLPDPSRDVGQSEREGVSEQVHPRLSMAKATAFGPPLDVSGASQLRWAAYREATSETISEAPWSLRDGSILIVRDEWEYSVMSPQAESAFKSNRGSRSSHAVKFSAQRARPVERELNIAVWGKVAKAPAP